MSKDWRSLLIEAAASFDADGRTRNCRSCRFWDGVPVLLGAQPGDGLCRRHAPQTTHDHYQGFPLWPNTQASDWCGEFDAKMIERPQPEGASKK